jgi:hypothetical protein
MIEARAGVPDYCGRGFFLEVVVVAILLTEIVFLFRGKGPSAARPFGTTPVTLV